MLPSNDVFTSDGALLMLNGFLQIMDRAIVVHKNPDDLTADGDGLGNAGDRIGCCVITAGAAK